MMETAVSHNMCRCCASEGAFKDVKTTYHWMGEEEIYADMLRECFDVNLNLTEECEENGICEVCITQLRNAINFKKQVLHTEEHYKKLVQNKSLYRSDSILSNIVKIEATADEDSEENVSADDGFSGPEYDVPIKTEEEEPKPKKRAAATKAVTRSKKTKADTGETSTKHLRSSTREQRESSPIYCEVEDKKLTLDRKLNFTSFVSIRPVGKSTLPWVREHQKKIAEERRLTELDWQFDNIKTILKCSNASPIRCRVGSRFACSYCLDQFQDPKELRAHSVKDHVNDKAEFFNARSLTRHIVYLDITDLKCKICNENIDSLEQLMDHLKSAHDELIHKQIKNQIVPFKYEGGKVLCGVCAVDIGEYTDLQDHMSEHYRNYICGFCDAGFVIRCKMLDHKKAVHLV